MLAIPVPLSPLGNRYCHDEGTVKVHDNQSVNLLHGAWQLMQLKIGNSPSINSETSSDWLHDCAGRQPEQQQGNRQGGQTSSYVQ